MLAYVVSNGSLERAIPFDGNHWSCLCVSLLLFVFELIHNKDILVRLFLFLHLTKKASLLNMSFLDKMKAAGKNVVDAGAKTMLKVSGGVKTTQRLVTQRLCLNLDVQ